MVARLEVRLDEERKQRLEQLGEAQGVPVSEVVRTLIDAAWEDAMRARRLAAVERMARLEVELPPDPEKLSRELEETYEPGGLP